MNFIELNETDFKVRLQLIESKLADLTNTLVNKVKIGAEDLDCRISELEIIGNMLDYIRCYELDFEKNCITECDLLKMFDYISLKLQITFQLPGFKYT